MIIDFFHFWYSMKPFQINIDIKNKKMFMKGNLELETTRHMKKLYKFYKMPEVLFFKKNN